MTDALIMGRELAYKALPAVAFPTRRPADARLLVRGRILPRAVVLLLRRQRRKDRRLVGTGKWRRGGKAARHSVALWRVSSLLLPKRRSARKAIANFKQVLLVTDRSVLVYHREREQNTNEDDIDRVVCGSVVSHYY